MFLLSLPFNIPPVANQYLILVLDYYNNSLKIITTLASEFMSSTYGPIKFFTPDINQDNADDVVVYSTKDMLEEHILLSSSSQPSNTTVDNVEFSSLVGLKNKQKSLILGLNKGTA